MNVNKSKKCPVCNGTGWIKSKAEEVAQLTRISGLLPEEMSLPLSWTTATGWRWPAGRTRCLR